MQKSNRYYVVDKVAEVIIGSFTAINDMMAQKIMKGFDFDKAKLTPEEIFVLKDPKDLFTFETFNEVISNKTMITMDLTFLVQPSLIEDEVEDV